MATPFEPIEVTNKVITGIDKVTNIANCTFKVLENNVETNMSSKELNSKLHDLVCGYTKTLEELYKVQNSEKGKGLLLPQLKRAEACLDSYNDENINVYFIKEAVVIANNTERFHVLGVSQD